MLHKGDVSGWGQVYRLTLPSYGDVAVKVQRLGRRFRFSGNLFLSEILQEVRSEDLIGHRRLLLYAVVHGLAMPKNISTWTAYTALAPADGLSKTAITVGFRRRHFLVFQVNLELRVQFEYG